MVVALLVFFPVMINMVRGLMQVEPAALELMRSYGGQRPVRSSGGCACRSALPYVFSAFKVGTTLASSPPWSANISAAPGNLARPVHRPQAALFHFEAWAAIVVASFFGIVFYPRWSWWSGS